MKSRQTPQIHEKNSRYKSTIYLCAPVNALVEGIFEENIHLDEVLRHGNFGLGTFDDLDGEMLILDGICYQVKADGKVLEVNKNTLTPFAAVTFYRPNKHFALDGELDYGDFLKWLHGILPSPNLFYAIRIEGEFTHIKARSVPKQANYHPLSEVANNQVFFDFPVMTGTVAGFYTPDFMASLNVPGMHLHFLSTDLQHGGHILDCRPRKVKVGLQVINKLELSLPMTHDFMEWDFHRDTTEDLNKLEK